MDAVFSIFGLAIARGRKALCAERAQRKPEGKEGKPEDPQKRNGTSMAQNAGTQDAVGMLVFRTP